MAVAGEWHEWTWDETLFAGAAEHYERGRLPYAPGLVDGFAAALGLDGTGRLLDVGCGPGTVALPLAASFAEVVGLDPDRAMLAEASRLAAERGVGNARWVAARAEDLPGALGPRPGRFRAVTFAASFHWMDRPRVAAVVRRLVEPAGVVVHVDGRRGDLLAPVPDLPPVPQDVIEALRRRYLGPDRRAGASIRNTSPGDEDDVWRAAGFVGPDITVVADRRALARSVDDVVAEVLSMSGTAPHLFGDRLGAFVADLRAVLAAAAGAGTDDGRLAGRFGVRLPDTELKVWRPSP
jgi:SAM-dependent methyltransferase